MYSTEICSALDVRFSDNHLDLVGPLATSQGYHYFLTVVDIFVCAD